MIVFIYYAYSSAGYFDRERGRSCSYYWLHQRIKGKCTFAGYYDPWLYCRILWDFGAGDYCAPGTRLIMITIMKRNQQYVVHNMILGSRLLKKTNHSPYFTLRPFYAFWVWNFYFTQGILPLKDALVNEPEDHIKSAAAWSLCQIGRHTPGIKSIGYRKFTTPWMLFYCVLFFRLFV